MTDRAEALRRELQYDKTTAGYIVECLDAADKAAGIYRVSLDVAVEAAAKAMYESTGADWTKASEQTRHASHETYRFIVTAAVMGGAQ